MKIKNMKINTKLFGAFGITMIIFLVVGLFLLRMMSGMKALEDQAAGRANDALRLSEIEMLNDELYGVIANGIINKNFEETSAKLTGILEELDNGVTDIKKIAATDREKQLSKEIENGFREIISIASTKVLPELRKGDAMDVVFLRRINDDITVIFERVDAKLIEMTHNMKNEARVASETFNASYLRSIRISIAVLAFGIAMGLIFSFIITRLIKKSLQNVVEASEKLARGDLTARVAMDQKDEFGQVSNSINTAIVNLENLVSEIIASARNLSQAVAQISSGNQDLSQRTAEQASNLEEVASTLEEATVAINQNADNAQIASKDSEGTCILAEEGGRVVGDAVNAIKDINDSSKKIGEIITVINEISFQTNLLALNAAVEAARAGEQGRGFAVVAGEVRTLAQRASGAAKEIEKLINDSINKVNRGTNLVDKSGESLKEIIRSITQVSRVVSEIAAASREQKQGISQINTAITEMDTMTQQNASLVEETASASEEMANQAQELLHMMDRFKIKENGTKENRRKSEPKKHEQHARALDSRGFEEF